MSSRWMSLVAVLALSTLAACTRLPRATSDTYVAPATERPPIVEQHTSGQALGSPGTVTAAPGSGTLEREPTPPIGNGSVVTDPVLKKIRDELEAEAEAVRGKQ